MEDDNNIPLSAEAQNPKTDSTQKDNKKLAFPVKHSPLYLHTAASTYAGDENAQMSPNLSKPSYGRTLTFTPTIAGMGYLNTDSGFVVGADGDKLLRHNTDKHFITFAPSGSGTTGSAVIPNLLTHKGSAFVVGFWETAIKETYQYRKHVLGQNIVVIDPMQSLGLESDTFNPLDTLNPAAPDFSSRAGRMAGAILGEPKDMAQPFFHLAPKELLKSLIIYVKTSPEVKEDQRNLPYIVQLLHGLNEDESNKTLPPHKRFEQLLEKFWTDASEYRHQLRSTASLFRGSANESARDVVATLSYHLSFATDRYISQSLKKSSFDPACLREKKTTVYVVMNDSAYPWLRLLVESAIDACPSDAEAKTKYQKNDDRILFMLDDFTQLGALSSVNEGMTGMRNKGITLWAKIQDIGLLQAVYGETIANSFIGNAGCVQAVQICDSKTAEYFAALGTRQISFSRTIDGNRSEIGSQAISTSHRQNWSDYSSFCCCNCSRRTGSMSTSASIDTVEGVIEDLDSGDKQLLIIKGPDRIRKILTDRASIHKTKLAQNLAVETREAPSPDRNKMETVVSVLPIPNPR
jgi:type IV secretory pathway TraG/TraD family ATPase VirD4